MVGCHLMLGAVGVRARIEPTRRIPGARRAPVLRWVRVAAPIGGRRCAVGLTTVPWTCLPAGRMIESIRSSFAEDTHDTTEEAEVRGDERRDTPDHRCGW